MMSLKDKLGEKIDAWRPRTTKLLKEHGAVKISDVTIAQAIGGARGVRCLVTDISYLDPNEGIRFRGLTIPETLEALPKVPGAEMPYVEGHMWLLLTGDVPTENEVKELAKELQKRGKVPGYVWDVLRAMPKDSHPMAMFSTAIVAMEGESAYRQAYEGGLGKMDHWQPTLEDALNLWARLPQVGAFIYRLKYKDDKQIDPDPKLDLGGNFAHMMGIEQPYDEVARLYFILHSDHESGNVSAHAGHLIGSALSDPYFAISGMVNGLAGPLHGLANQEVLRWIQGVMDQMGGKIPSEEEMKQFVWDTLNSGQVVRATPSSATSASSTCRTTRSSSTWTSCTRSCRRSSRSRARRRTRGRTWTRSRASSSGTTACGNTTSTPYCSPSAARWACCRTSCGTVRSVIRSSGRNR
jgi:citrate synthase